jgi:UDP-N-acetyl-D-galactosamine dehydrogenase
VKEMPEGEFEAAVVAVAHKEFETIDLSVLVRSKHIIYDVKGILKEKVVNGRL